MCLWTEFREGYLPCFDSHPIICVGQECCINHYITHLGPRVWFSQASNAWWSISKLVTCPDDSEVYPKWKYSPVLPYAMTGATSNIYDPDSWRIADYRNTVVSWIEYIRIRYQKETKFFHHTLDWTMIKGNLDCLNQKLNIRSNTTLNTNLQLASNFAI